MLETNATASQILRAYYEILTGGIATFDEGRLHNLLAADLDFEGPIAGSRVGAELFVEAVAGFVKTMRRLDMLRQLQGGTSAATLYDAEMPGGIVRFAEFFRIAGGRIRSLRLLFDATQYQARGGRWGRTDRAGTSSAAALGGSVCPRRAEASSPPGMTLDDCVQSAGCHDSAGPSPTRSFL
ncbi:MAG: nuclear transport factor 2 family protein [Candidatus Dormibacteria bacterium]